MAKGLVSEEQMAQYNAEAAYRSNAYWDSVEEKNPLVQGFRYIMKNYDISFEKQERLGKRGDGYRICISKRKRPRIDL